MYRNSMLKRQNMVDFLKFKSDNKSEKCEKTEKTSDSSSKSSESSSKKSSDDESIFSKYSSKISSDNDTGNTGSDWKSAVDRLKSEGIDVKVDGDDKAGLNAVLKGKGSITYGGKKMSLAQGIANSFDSMLDLYIQDAVVKAWQSCNKKDGAVDLKNFLKEGSKGRAALAAMGIVVNDVKVDGLDGAQAWSFSLVDKNGNIMKDSDGKLGSCIFGDILNADGMIQNAELNFPNILDELGYECITKADFKGTDTEFYDMIKEIEKEINSPNNIFKGNQTIKDIYGKLGLSFYDDAGKEYKYGDGGYDSASGYKAEYKNQENLASTTKKIKETDRDFNKSDTDIFNNKKETGNTKNKGTYKNSESIDNQAINDYYRYLIEKIKKVQSKNNGYVSDADLNDKEWQVYSEMAAEYDTDTLKHARAQAHIRFKSEHANNPFYKNKDKENEEKVLA